MRKILIGFLVWLIIIIIFFSICWLPFLQLKKVFPKKNLPPPPPKGLLRMKSRALLEEVGNVFLLCQALGVIWSLFIVPFRRIR